MSSEKELFAYPDNGNLRDAYVAILGRVIEQKRIRHTVFSCCEAICEYKGWVCDYDPQLTHRAPGQKYKQALKMLKALEPTYSFFPSQAPGIIEICVYDAVTKLRVNNFKDLLKMAVHDKYASEFCVSSAGLVFQPWNDPVSMASEDEEAILARVNHEASMLRAATIANDNSFKSSFQDSYRSNLSGELQNYISTLIGEDEEILSDLEG